MFFFRYRAKMCYEQCEVPLWKARKSRQLFGHEKYLSMYTSYFLDFHKGSKNELICVFILFDFTRISKCKGGNLLKIILFIILNTYSWLFSIVCKYKSLKDVFFVYEYLNTYTNWLINYSITCNPNGLFV